MDWRISWPGQTAPVVENLQEILDGMRLVERNPDEMVFASSDHRAIVELRWERKRKTWLLTAYRTPPAEGIVDVSGAAEGGRPASLPGERPQTSVTQ